MTPEKFRVLFSPVDAQRAFCVAPAALLVATLTACGGGAADGSGGIYIPPTISSISVSSVKYAQTVTLTIKGSNLDQAITVSTKGCTDVKLSSTEPFVSTPTTAYYQCTASAVGTFSVDLLAETSSTPIGSTSLKVPVPQVTMTVDNGAGVSGTMVMTLAPDKTPVTVNNFLAYVNADFYKNTIFHRTAADFVIQGGGYEPLTVGQPPVLKPTRPPIALEVGKGLSNLKFTVAMARSSQLASATSQFFVNLVDNVPLDTNNGGYAVFGSVTVGTDVVNAIAAAPCTPFKDVTAAPECTPSPNMVITSATQTQ